MHCQECHAELVFDPRTKLYVCPECGRTYQSIYAGPGGRLIPPTAKPKPLANFQTEQLIPVICKELGLDGEPVSLAVSFYRRFINAVGRVKGRVSSPLTKRALALAAIYHSSRIHGAPVYVNTLLKVAGKAVEKVGLNVPLPRVRTVSKYIRETRHIAERLYPPSLPLKILERLMSSKQLRRRCHEKGVPVEGVKRLISHFIPVAWKAVLTLRRHTEGTLAVATVYGAWVLAHRKAPCIPNPSPSTLAALTGVRRSTIHNVWRRAEKILKALGEEETACNVEKEPYDEHH